MIAADVAAQEKQAPALGSDNDQIIALVGNAADSHGSLTDLMPLLDSSKYAVREGAQRKLKDWASRHPQPLAAVREIKSQLARSNWSLEARIVLEGLLASLPPGQEQGPPPDIEAIDGAVMALAVERSEMREATLWQLEQWTSCEPPAICLVVERLRHHLARSDLNVDARKRLEYFHLLARRTWVLSDRKRWALGSVGDDDLRRWVAELVLPEQEKNLRTIDTAMREILDRLVQDELAEKIGTLIEEQSQQPGLTRAAMARLHDLADWCRPGLVAEVWTGRELSTVQFLQVGVPQHPFGAPRVTLFDQANDKVARCVSGNSLEPGYYPVGEAIAHPYSPGPLFHLTNTATPRQQMAYRYEAQMKTARQRLQEITARTLRNWTQQRKQINERQVLLLEAMDPEVVSRDIGEYFLKIDDQRAEPIDGFFPDESRHFAKICVVLARVGTRTAVPGLQAAIEKRRFLPPRSGEEKLEWGALLSIAARDPWDGLDQWLLELSQSEEKLSAYTLGNAEDWDATLGACAAGLFLKRRGLEPEEYGLRSLIFRRNIPELSWYRFQTPADRRHFLHTWAQAAKATSSEELKLREIQLP